MFMLSIIIGSLFCPNYCYEVNKANVTRTPADSSPFNINVGEASRNSTHSNGPSPNINDNHKSSQIQTTPSQNQFKPVTATPENIYKEEPFIDRIAHQTTNRPYVNPGCIGQTNSGSSQDINDNYRPSQTQTTAPSQNQFNPVTTTTESLFYWEELFNKRFSYQTTERPYANPGCIGQTNSGSSQDNCTSQNGDVKLRPPTLTVNISMRAEAKPEIGGKPVPPFSEYPEKNVGNRDSSVALSSKPNSWGFYDDDNADPPVKVEREKFLWQVSVFSKEVSPRVRVCGGSLVTSSAVISAAQCYWGVGPLPADQFSVAAGEAGSHITDEIEDYDAYQHWRDVRDIKLPPRFRGAASSFQDDLAVVVLARPLPPALKPVCVSFDWELDEQQLMGSVGWVLGIEKVERYGSIVRRHRVPHLAVEQCLPVAPEDQLRFLTSDKFCAGFRGAREPPLCNYDNGSGLIYYQDLSHSIPFLRGVVSLPLGDSCVTVFTHVGTHRAFLLRHISGLEAECARHYPGAGGAVKEEGGDKLFVCNCYC